MVFASGQNFVLTIIKNTNSNNNQQQSIVIQYVSVQIIHRHEEPKLYRYSKYRQEWRSKSSSRRYGETRDIRRYA